MTPIQSTYTEKEALERIVYLIETLPDPRYLETVCAELRRVVLETLASERPVPPVPESGLRVDPIISTLDKLDNVWEIKKEAHSVGRAYQTTREKEIAEFEFYSGANYIINKLESAPIPQPAAVDAEKEREAFIEKVADHLRLQLSGFGKRMLADFMRQHFPAPAVSVTAEEIEAEAGGRYRQHRSVVYDEVGYLAFQSGVTWLLNKLKNEVR